MNSILIGVDESERSDDAIAFGRRLARVSSAPAIVACTFPYYDMPNRAANVQYRNYLRDDAEKTACKMRDRLGVDRSIIRIIAEPSVAKGLDHIATSEKAGIVIVGSTHTGRLGRVAPGSTAERLLHGSPCAVAVVPQGYREQDERPIGRIGVAYNGSPEADEAVTAAIELARAFGARIELIGVVSTGHVRGPADDVSGGLLRVPRAGRERDGAVTGRRPGGAAGGRHGHVGPTRRRCSAAAVRPQRAARPAGHGLARLRAAARSARRWRERARHA